MGKALVIKGTNFLTNKLDTVTIGDMIPCTGIELSESTATFNAIGETLQLVATVTPENTTDNVEWISSDTDVVSVNSSGLVTCVGIGTATITAICGEQSDECAITVTVIINADTALAKTNGVYADSTDLNSNPVKDYVSETTGERGRIYYLSDNVLEGKKAYVKNTATVDTYPIPLPKGTKHISIPKVAKVGYIRLVALNSQQFPTNVSVGSNYARVVAAVYLTSGTSAELDIPDTADSFVFGLYTSSGNTGESISETVNVICTGSDE